MIITSNAMKLPRSTRDSKNSIGTRHKRANNGKKSENEPVRIEKLSARSVNMNASLRNRRDFSVLNILSVKRSVKLKQRNKRNCEQLGRRNAMKSV